MTIDTLLRSISFKEGSGSSGPLFRRMFMIAIGQLCHWSGKDKPNGDEGRTRQTRAAH